MNNLLTVIILVAIIVLILEVVIFHRLYETQEERDCHMHKLWVAVLVTIVVAVIASMLLKSDQGKSEDGEEYGIFSAAKENIRNYRERQSAYRKAKKEGLSDEEADQRRAQIKEDQRQVKRAGVDAKAEAAKRLAEKRAGGGSP